MMKCSPWEEPTLENFTEGCISWEGPNAGAREQHEEEELAEVKHDEMTTIPILHIPCTSWRGRGRRFIIKFEPGKR